VYTSLLEERRRELHRVVGAALEELETDELSEAYGLLAHHFAQADEPKRAARYLLEAGNAARAVYADDAAIAHYRRALTFLDRLGDAAKARAVLFKIALAHHLAFDFEAADAAWAEASTRPEPPPVRLEPTERLETSLLRPHSFVPGHGYDIVSWSFGSNLFVGLLRLERGLDVVPDLAERLSVSQDGCTYTFRLRAGLRWSDGEPLTADDFAFTYREMREQSVNSAHLLSDVEAEAQSEQVLVLRFPEPRAYILYLLAQLPFCPWPRHHVETVGQRWREERFALVGNGPFVATNISESSAECAANPHWHGSRGDVEHITVRFREWYEALDDWRSGRFDYLLLTRLEDLADTSHTDVLPIPALSVGYIGFPEHPPFDDERVRKALAHGLDRAPLVAGSGDLPAYGGLLPPAMPGHSHDAAPTPDLVLARTLLADAGYPGGHGLPELRLIHADFGLGERLRREIGARWAGQWQELGVRLKQEWVPFMRVYPEASRDVSFWEWAWISDYPDPHGMLGGLLEQALTPVPRDDELLGLLDRAQSLRSRDERLGLYRKADHKLVAERAWFVPTVYDNWYVAHRPWVHGLWAHPLGMGPLRDVVLRR
jgi:oligopeptide transport system substrate-binding protein